MTINLPGKYVLFLDCTTSPRTGANWCTWPLWMERAVSGGKIFFSRIHLPGLNPAAKSRSTIYKLVSKQGVRQWGLLGSKNQVIVMNYWELLLFWKGWHIPILINSMKRAAHSPWNIKLYCFPVNDTRHLRKTCNAHKLQFFQSD